MKQKTYMEQINEAVNEQKFDWESRACTNYLLWQIAITLGLAVDTMIEMHNQRMKFEQDR